MAMNMCLVQNITRCSLSLVISNGCALLLCCHTRTHTHTYIHTQHNDDTAFEQINRTTITTTKPNRSYRIENAKIFLRKSTQNTVVVRHLVLSRKIKLYRLALER